jgi:hypothetical protein
VSLEKTIVSIFENRPSQQALLSQPFSNTTNGNWTEYSRKLASVISLVIQSQRNLDAKNITGDAFGPELYIEIRWLWFSGPLSMVLLSILFLIMTILKSSRREYRFKTSILAILFHRLESGCEVQNSQAEMDGDKIDTAVLKLAKSMKVRLRENNKGNLKLKKDW